jgi:hypothetical protein
MRIWIKDLTDEIKTVIDREVGRDLPVYARAIRASKVDTDRLQYAKRCIVSIMLIHRVIYTGHIEHLVYEMRRRFLN